MRLHRLEATAFGPFAGSIAVNFDALGRNGLFLVHGPTGAGKTSLLDAVCFALYAGVPGVRPGGRALRSDHAAPDVVPTVRLEFGVGAQRFRVTRSPEFLRPKKRGEGQTRAPATVVLEEHTGGQWRGKSTRADEVGDIVTEVLGMGLDQFSKVVLLPQGEFAAFLRATADERRALLEKLFDISTYAGVEEWLVERRRVLAARQADEQALLATDLARLRDVLADLPADVLTGVPADLLTEIVSGEPPGPPAGRAPEAPRDLPAGAPEDRPPETPRDLPAGAPEDRPPEAPADRAAAARVAGGPRPPGPLRRSSEAPSPATGRGSAAREVERLCATLPAVLDALDGQLRSHAVSALAFSTVAEAQAKVAQDAVADIATLASLQQRGRAAQQVLAAFEADAERWTVLRETVERAVRADVVAGDLRGLSRARRRSLDARSRAESARSAMAALESPPLDVAGAAALHETLAEHRGALDEARMLARRLWGDRARLETLTGSRNEQHRRLERSRAAVADAQRAVEVAAADVEALAAAVRSRDAAQLRVDRCASAHEASTQLDAAVGRADGARTAVVEARQAEQDAREELLALQQARLDGMAAELAGQLTEGLPCAVCGSREHPAPAPPGAAVSPAQVVVAEQRWERLREATGRHRATLGALQQLVETKSGELAEAVAALLADWPTALERPSAGDTPSTADVGQWVRQTHTALAAACAEVDRLSGADLRRAELQARRESLSADAEEAARALAATDAAVAEVRSRLARETTAVTRVLATHASECPCAALVGGKASEDVDESLQGHEGVAAAVAELHEALVAQAAHLEDLSAVEESTLEALHSQRFETVDDVLEAAVPPEHLADLRRQLRDLEERRVTAQAALSDPDVAAALTRPEADADTAARVADAARAEVRRAQDAQTRAEASLRALEQIKACMRERLRVLWPLVAQAAQVAELADAVVGVGSHNALRMRLTAFVLAARLEKVATLANERLRVMGDGRYQLAHSDNIAPGGRRSGLGLVVHDQWTGQVRETSSLSGGESFMASLALALGLADAVREEAGGFDLNTLFVDEGFGTLDDESLEQVMSVLDGLRDGGRCVGVVSHVGDLRSRIPVQVRVDKTSTGSSVTVLGVSSAAA